MKIFIWRNGRPEAQSGYNDDLVMAFSMAMYVRDTALKFRQRGIDLTLVRHSTDYFTFKHYLTAGIRPNAH